MNKPTIKQLARLQHSVDTEWQGKFPPDSIWMEYEVLQNFSRDDVSELISYIDNNRYECATIILGNNYLDFIDKKDKDNGYDESLEADVDMVNQAEQEEEAQQLQNWNDLAEERMYL
jgi:hypothetical protein